MSSGIKYCVPIILALTFRVSAQPAGSALDRAVSAELKRSMEELRQEDYPRPYYISLTATDLDVAEGACAMGVREFSDHYSVRLLSPDLRVGGYALDNHPMGPAGGYSGTMAPRGENEFGLRHELWRALDRDYKIASADFLRKEALRVRRGQAEYDTDDMTREPPRVHESSAPAPAFEAERLERLCAEASAAFREAPSLLEGEASYSARASRSRLYDTEGGRVDFDRAAVEFDLDASTVAADGMRLKAVRRFVVTTPEDLPPAETLREKAREMTAELAALRLVSSTSPFGGPALLDPAAAAAVILSIAQRLTGEEMRNPSGAQTFRGKLGRRVLPAEFTLVDDPSARSFSGVPLVGRYDYDDQGVPAQPATLIDRGILKGFLLSRYPVIGFARSNGHGRAAAGHHADGAPANLFFRTARPASSKELLRLLRRECAKRGKPYGLWVRGLNAFVQEQSASAEGSIRLMPGLLYLVEAATGRLVLVRGLDVVGTPLAMLANLVKAGADAQAANFTQYLPVSVVAPSLLLSEAELQRSREKPERPPILPAPRP